MASEPGPRADHPSGGAHGLGVQVVGLRIVVRRVLRGQRGPTGGPAMTDLLGVCLSWGDGVCVVAPETGPAVEIAVADIVSGKPVPPRPPTRLRITPDAAQRRAMRLFPDLEISRLGGWTLRWSPKQTARRARSVLAMRAGDLDPDAAYAGVVDFYAARGARPVAAVLPDSEEERLFTGRGWVPESEQAETVFALAGVAAARRRLPPVGVEVTDSDLGMDVEAVGDVGTAVHPGLGLSGVTGTGVVDGDWIGLRGIHVPTHLRRRGLGAQVLSVLLEWGAERGATTAYLQVLSDNAPALALYERVGFVEHHRYRYLAPPVG